MLGLLVQSLLLNSATNRHALSSLGETQLECRLHTVTGRNLRPLLREITSRDAIVVHRQAANGHSDVAESPLQALVALFTLFHGPVCILYHVSIPTLIPVHAALPDGLETFAI